MSVDRDIIKADKLLNIKKRAAAHAAHNIPRANKKKKDGFASRVDAVLENFTQKQCANTRERVLEINAWIGALAGRMHKTYEELRGVYHSVAEGMLDSNNQGYQDLLNLYEDYTEAHNSLEHFRKDNNITRNLYYPPRPFWNWTILASVFVAGGLLAAHGLQGAHPGGVLGALSAIAIISLFNSGAGFFIGFVYRYTNHYHALKRQLGWLAVLLALSLLLFFNYTAGHYYAALASASADINSWNLYAAFIDEVTQTMLSNPMLFLYSEFNYVTFASLGFSAIAGWKAYNWSDPYPGYARYARLVDEYNDAYQDGLMYHYEVLNEHKDNAIAKIEGVGTGFEDNLQTIDDYRQEIGSLRQKHLEYVASLETAGKRFYDTYREENIRKRSDEARPPCFEIAYTMSNQFKVDFEIEMEQEAQRAVYKHNDDMGIEERIEEAIDKISDVHQRCCDIYTLIDSPADIKRSRWNTTKKKIAENENKVRAELGIAAK